MKRRPFLAFAVAMLALPACGPTSAADLLPAVAARLDNAPVIQGRFEQTRRLAGFTNPLVSRGDFVLLRARGLSWVTREPVASSLLITPDRLVVRDGDGRIQQQIRADAQPGLRAVSEAMLAVLRGDFSALTQRFQLDGKLVGKQGWSLTLTPTDPAMRHMFTRIELAGDRFVREVRLDEAGGDSTLLRMLATTASAAPSADQERRFD